MLGDSIYDTSKAVSEISGSTFDPSRKKEGHNLIKQHYWKVFNFLKCFDL